MTELNTSLQTLEEKNTTNVPKLTAEAKIISALKNHLKKSLTKKAWLHSENAQLESERQKFQQKYQVLAEFHQTKDTNFSAVTN